MSHSPITSHSAADVVAQLLVQLSLGTDPTAGGDWPVHVGNEPNDPDNCITVYDTQGVLDGRAMRSGLYQEHHGVQIRVRSTTHKAGYAKARQVSLTLDNLQYVHNAIVDLDGLSYLVGNLSRKGTVNALGKDVTNSKCSLFTLNHTVVVHEQT